jgi:hypothetical protein
VVGIGLKELNVGPLRFGRHHEGNGVVSVQGSSDS